MSDCLKSLITFNSYEGIPVASFISKERMIEVKEKHKVLPDDVFIATYQKCGTTWLQFILNELYNHPQGEHENINQAVPWLEEETQENIDKLKSPRLFKTHDRYRWIPKGPGVKYIFCYRNPKDVACSYYNHILAFKGHYKYQGSFDEYFDEIFMDPQSVENGFYLDFLQEWLQQRSNPQILFVTYEEMVEDLTSVIRRIVEFLGLQKSDEEIEKVARSSMFESMQKNTFVNYSWRNGAIKDETKKFMRKGKVGSWQEQLSAEQSKRMEDVAKEMIEEPFGIKFKYTL